MKLVVAHRFRRFSSTMMTLLSAGLAALAVLGSPASAFAAARDVGPAPPCGGDIWPLFSAAGAPPAIATWRAADLVKWTPPACTGWPSDSRSRLVVALAATFRFAGSIEALLTRLGSISTLRHVRYWSATDKTWRTLALDAAALASSNPKTRRSDFAASELAKGSQLHYWVKDSRSGSVVYRMGILERNSRRIVLASENASPVRALSITLFEPGVLQTVQFLERRGPDSWTVYLLSRIDRRASVFAAGHEASFVNRAVALYRHLAGIPTDQTPPASP